MSGFIRGFWKLFTSACQLTASSFATCVIRMLMGRTDVLPELVSSKDLLLSDPVSDLNEDEEAESAGQIIFTASFEELASKIVQYDTIVWVLISLLLVLAWGIGLLMLLYLPFKRYVLQKEISSRKLYVTPHEIVYQVFRPSFIPFWGVVTIEKHVSLPHVIDIIVEQGCLQSVYEIHNFRVESIAHGKAAPVAVLQVQGVDNPGLLRKTIIIEAAKAIQEFGKSWKQITQITEGESMVRTGSFTKGPSVLRSPLKTSKFANSPHDASFEHRSVLPPDLFLHKLEEVNKSVKKIELLIEQSHASPHSS